MTDDEELTARLRNYGHVGTVLEAADRIEALIAKLAKAVEVLKALDATLDRNGWHVDSIAREDIRATLAEIKGESHDRASTL